MSKLLKKIAVKSPRLQFLHGYFSRILIGFQNNCFFFRTTHSNCIFILMNFYFRWDNDFFLFSVFSVFFNWKDNTLDFLKTLLFILVCGPLVWTCSWQTGGGYLPPLPRVLIKMIFFVGELSPIQKVKEHSCYCYCRAQIHFHWNPICTKWW